MKCRLVSARKPTALAVYLVFESTRLKESERIERGSPSNAKAVIWRVPCTRLPK